MRSARWIWLPSPPRLSLSPCSTIHRLCTRKSRVTASLSAEWSPVAVVSLLIVMIIGNNHLHDYNQVWYPALGKLLLRLRFQVSINLKWWASEHNNLLLLLSQIIHYRYQMLWWDGMLYEPAWKAWGCESCLKSLPLLTEPYWHIFTDLPGPFSALLGLTQPYWALLSLT